MKQHVYIVYGMHHVSFVCYCANYWLDYYNSLYCVRIC